MSFTLELGRDAPDFDLPGVDGKNYSLAGFSRAEVLIVVFSCNHCPYVVGSEDRMNDLYADYISRGVEMVAINSNEEVNHPTDSFEHMVARAAEKDFTFAYVRDESQDIAKAYGALRTPHYYVFDADRKLRYTGRMDDNPRQASAETTRELRDALDELLSGAPVSTPVTNPIGCNVKWKDQDAHWMPPDACDLI
ncbi:MAG: thioredoxin family protein [Phycisphaerae bacterium]|jgi:peroxiredoxin|nr:thioredoxin family protein [Phycisphaerae bacterium]MDP7290073.1 thioredoxin family protein [Phycisphaerae bacterium]